MHECFISAKEAAKETLLPGFGYLLTIIQSRQHWVDAGQHKCFVSVKATAKIPTEIFHNVVNKLWISVDNFVFLFCRFPPPGEKNFLFPAFPHPIGVPPNSSTGVFHPRKSLQIKEKRGFQQFQHPLVLILLLLLFFLYLFYLCISISLSL